MIPFIAWSFNVRRLNIKIHTGLLQVSKHAVWGLNETYVMVYVMVKSSIVLW